MAKPIAEIYKGRGFMDIANEARQARESVEVIPIFPAELGVEEYLVVRRKRNDTVNISKKLGKP